MRDRVTVRILSLCCFLTAAGWAVAQSGAGQVIQGSKIEDILKNGRVAKTKDLPVGVTLPKKATLDFNGEQHSAVWKNIDEGPVPTKQLDSGVELQFQDSWRTEVAAYELDKLIGLGMVPATVQRSFDGKQGSMQFFVDSAHGRRAKGEEKDHAAKPDFMEPADRKDPSLGQPYLQHGPESGKRLDNLGLADPADRSLAYIPAIRPIEGS